jgi:hypothetical protein
LPQFQHLAAKITQGNIVFIKARRFVGKKFIIAMLCCLLVTGCIFSFDNDKTNEAGVIQASVTDPLNATYIIQGQKIRLIDGRSETEAIPGSATKVITSVFGKPVYGNIDGEGSTDAALILTHDPGGSGTFYYVAAALNANGSYIGTRAILLGDRVTLQNISVRNGLIIADYADHRLGEPMTASPSVKKSKYLVLEHNVLKETPPLTKGEEVLEGWVTIGHEVRSFVPCSQARELWLPGNSPVLNEVMTAYRKALPGSLPYTPLFMTLVGKTAGPVSDGFGVDYEASFFTTQLVKVFPKGNCKGDLIYVDSPLPGSHVSSPLKIRGYARGKWFFERDFPVILVDANGEFIAQGYATAKTAWMTKMFVPFESVIKFKPPGSGSKGTLVLKKDNPTDRQKFDNALEIPVFFK